jgi:hypothetical protein
MRNVVRCWRRPGHRPAGIIHTKNSCASPSYSAQSVGQVARIERALTQRLYILDREILPADDDAEAFRFSVLGSTLATYNVQMEHRRGQALWSCTCPDFATRRERCKHIYLVIARLVNCSTFRLVEAASEQHDLLVAICRSVCTAGAGSSLPPSKEPSSKKVPPRALDPDESCAICFESLTAAEPLNYCSLCCGKSVHALCFRQWTRCKGATCVHCRANMPVLVPKFLSKSTKKRRRAENDDETNSDAPAKRTHEAPTGTV